MFRLCDIDALIDADYQKHFWLILIKDPVTEECAPPKGIPDDELADREVVEWEPVGYDEETHLPMLGITLLGGDGGLHRDPREFIAIPPEELLRCFTAGIGYIQGPQDYTRGKFVSSIRIISNYERDPNVRPVICCDTADQIIQPKRL